jgi:CO/xanthine dehydrogenase Mo-binding subunit
MEMHAITVKWEADDKVTLYEKTQFLAGTQEVLLPHLEFLPQMFVL